MIRLQLLGRVDLRLSDGSEPRSLLSQPKPLALLAFLAAASPAGYRRRDELLAVFWPELDSSRGRRALSQALHVIRGSLPEGAISTRGIEELGLDSGVIWSDVVEFRDAIKDENWERASSLYHGDLLSGFFIPGSTEFDQWLDKERSSLRRQASDALWHLSDAAESKGNIDGARDWSRRALELDPHDEEGLRRYMRLLARTGNPAQAIKTYDDYRARVARELELEPAPETRQLVDSLRKDVRPAKSSERTTVPERTSDVAGGALQERNVVVATTAGDPEIAGTASLTEPAGRDIKSPRVLLLGLSLLAVAAATTFFIRSRPETGASATRSSAAGIASRNNKIIVADFTSDPADSALARTVTDVIKLDLSGSHLVEVVSDAKAHDALLLMRRDTGTKMNPDIAREVAIREGVKAVLQGDVRRAAGSIEMTARLVSADNAQLTGGWHSTAKDSTEIVPAINTLSSSVRRDAGESMKTIAESSPLLHVSTSSLVALRKHAMGMAAFYDEDYRRSASLFEEAISIDTTFVDAYMMLAVSLAQSGAPAARQIEATIKAYRYRDRLRDAERYNVEAMYLSDVKGDIPGSIAASYNAAAIDPGIVFWGRLAAQLGRERRYAEAEAAARNGVRWIKNPIVYRILAYSLFRNGKIAEARSTMDSASKMFPRSAAAYAMQRVDFAEASGQYESADSLSHALPGPQPNVNALFYQAFTEAILGRVDDARSDLVEGRSIQSTGNRFDPSIRASVLLARLDLELAHDTVAALAVLDSAITKSNWTRIDPLERPYLTLAHFLLVAGKTDRAAQLLAEYDHAVPPDFRAKEQWLRRRTNAMLRVAHGDASAAEVIATDVYTDPNVMAAIADLLWSYRKLGQRQAAEKAAVWYLSEPTPLRLEDDAFNLANVLQFLEQSAATDRRSTDAAKYHARLTQLWRRADPQLKKRLQ